jgi:hypothetical protein
MWPGLSLRRLQLLGQASWTYDASPGEFAGFLFDSDVCEVAAEYVADSLDNCLSWDWDDLQVAYVFEGSVLFAGIAAWARRQGLEFKKVSTGFGYSIDTRGSRDHYWSSRSANVRRAMLTKRRVASSRGIVFEPVAAVTRQSFETLLTLHDARWGGTGGLPDRQRAFLRRLVDTHIPGLEFRISVLRTRDQVLSSVLNIDSKNIVYNLQSGFVRDWDTRLSLGKLHLGFEIDFAFESGRDAVDLLPGHGMKEDYKAPIATHQWPMYTLTLARSWRLRHALAARDAIRGLREKVGY